MSYDPYSLIIGQIVKGAARNMTESADSSKAAQRGGLGYGQAQTGMEYGQAPEMENTRISPTAQLAFIGTGGTVTPQMQKQIPVVGSALKAEERQLQNILPARGATSAASANGSTYNPDTFYSEIFKNYYNGGRGY